MNYVTRTIRSEADPDGFVERIYIDVKMMLKRCPICGKPAKTTHEYTPEGEDIILVECPDCGFHTTGFPTHEEAANNWNSRALIEGKCPLCGGDGLLEWPDDLDPEAGLVYTYRCQDCGASTALYAKKGDALRAWRRRAS